ncbi:hypothetical protein [Mesorhizobium xinjiangense]|uniref:hypothetical protein n=1 Tax=Mesorhizobium xinjiangense TaxID=2678685 RepID=UPI0012ECF077|nr:hypothetical protein [Mesorhizobium xinjiangense]
MSSTPTLIFSDGGDVDSVIIAPRILSRPLSVNGRAFGDRVISLIDYTAGDDEDDRVRHAAIPMSVPELQRALTDAKILKRVLWLSVRPEIPGLVHPHTGEPILICSLDWLDVR